MELIDISPDKRIYQANALTTSRFEFTACQLDILFMIMASLEKEDTINKKYAIRVMDIEAITGRKWNYQQVRESTQNLGSQMFEIGNYDDLVYTQLWLFQSVTFFKGKGYFEVSLAEKARELLFDLKDNYTVLQLKAALSCTSKYAKRIYTLACQWRTKGEILYSISDLKEILSLKDPKGIKKEQFTHISQFEEKVLKIAKRQINEHTDINFDYKLIKRGRSFERIKFFIGKPINIQTEIDFKDPLKPIILVDLARNRRRIESWGFKGKVVDDLLKLDFEELVKLSLQVNAKWEAKEIENAPAYFLGILQKKGLVYKKSAK